ncbi:unnamed protein product [Phytophthora lilii]|uniref:Unnamed protein product n=1 Tax=Phytophthora lilii TaxID=2077276 RepID=A0A9W6WQF4_9STRA|nr:unnamed protein product [Phytophthora lilii]
MERMRRTVAALELQKQQLMQHIAAESPCSTPGDECRSPARWRDLVVSTSSSLYPSPSVPVTRDDYVQLAAEIEEFRRQNAAMVQELARRDLFNNSIRYRLTSLPPLVSRAALLPTQLTHEEGMTCVWQTLERIHDARLLYASEERFHNRPTFLGWSQYSERQGDVVAFGVKKTLRNVTPQQLMDRSWQLQMNSDNLRRLGPSHLRPHITLLQKISDDVLIIDRRTEDQSRTSASGAPLVLRTAYVLFRVSDDDGTQTLGIKTLDVPVADRMLRDDEVWWDIFYWIRVSPAAPGADKEAVTVTEFGGANSCAHVDLVASRMKELVFLAIRWETLTVAPFPSY